MIIPAVSQVLVGNPVFGGTREVQTVQRMLSDHCVSAESYVQSAASVREMLASVESEAIDTLSLELEELLIPGGKSVYESSDAAWWALSHFLTECGVIESRAEWIERQVLEALDVVAASAEAIRAICAEGGIALSLAWNVLPPLEMPIAPALTVKSGGVISAATAIDDAARRGKLSAVWRTEVARWEEALSDIDGRLAEWRGLVEDRERLEERLIASLEDTAFGALAVLATATGDRVESVVRARLADSSLSAGWIDAKPRTAHPLLRLLLGSYDGSGVWNSPPDPDVVAERWESMPEHVREELIAQVPWVIGSLPGLPFLVRDRANRMMVDYYVLRQDLLDPRDRRLLAEVVRVMNDPQKDPPVSVVALNFEGEVPYASIGYGNLDESEYLTWAVPGMFSDAPSALPAWDRAMRTQHLEQVQQLRRAGKGHEQTSVIAFLSYDTPNQFTVLGSAVARAGAERIAAELDGTYATRHQNVPMARHGAIGHSYGTTALVEALLIVKHPVSQVTLVASAGLSGDGLESFDDIAVGRDSFGNLEVYTGLASSDWVARLGVNLSSRLQPNSTSVPYEWQRIEGATSFSVEGTHDLLPTEGHAILNKYGTGYFDVRTQSNVSIARIALGLPLDDLSDPVATGTEVGEER